MSTPTAIKAAMADVEAARAALKEKCERLAALLVDCRDCPSPDTPATTPPSKRWHPDNP